MVLKRKQLARKWQRKARTRGGNKIKVQPTMLLKTNEVKMSLSIEPTMCMKTNILTDSQPTMFMIPKVLSLKLEKMSPRVYTIDKPARLLGFIRHPCVAGETNLCRQDRRAKATRTGGGKKLSKNEDWSGDVYENTA
jgi:hypothetical protein